MAKEKIKSGNDSDEITNMVLSEDDLKELGFKGWDSVSPEKDAAYLYKNGRITINVNGTWNWFLDGEARNDIAVNSKQELSKLLKKYA